jgi:hypothetical protein
MWGLDVRMWQGSFPAVAGISRPTAPTAQRVQKCASSFSCGWARGRCDRRPPNLARSLESRSSPSGRQRAQRPALREATPLQHGASACERVRELQTMLALGPSGGFPTASTIPRGANNALFAAFVVSPPRGEVTRSFDPRGVEPPLTPLPWVVGSAGYNEPAVPTAALGGSSPSARLPRCDRLRLTDQGRAMGGTSGMRRSRRASRSAERAEFTSGGGGSSARRLIQLFVPLALVALVPGAIASAANRSGLHYPRTHGGRRPCPLLVSCCLC